MADVFVTNIYKCVYTFFHDFVTNKNIEFKFD